MSKRNLDRYMPPDWRFILSWQLIPPFIGILAGAMLPIVARLKTADIRTIYGIGVAAGVAGAFLLLVARMPIYKERRFRTIGPARLDRKHRWIYLVAYVFVLASLVLFAVVLLRT
jgi:hypothetical protein